MSSFRLLLVRVLCIMLNASETVEVRKFSFELLLLLVYVARVTCLCICDLGFGVLPVGLCSVDVETLLDNQENITG